MRLTARQKRAPEDSVEYRAWVLAAVLSGEIAVFSTGYFGLATALLVPALTVAAFVVSYYRRRERNFVLKILLSFAALALLAVFFREVLASLYDTRVPLARLFLWVQVIHAFDLPARKDLSYSLASGLILLAVGAVLSTSLVYGLFVVAFLICALGALAHMKLSEAREHAGIPADTASFGGRRIALGMILPGAVSVLVIGFTVFSLIPQRQSMNMMMLPTSFFQNVPQGFSGGIQNPYYKPPEGGDPFAGPPPAIAPDSYHGFNPYMDLRARGLLSDEIVMKVRSQEPVPYRGVVFDEYNGKGWVISTGDQAEELRSDGPRYEMGFADHTEPAHGPARQVAQIYHIERDASNVIFGAFRPETVFFPASGIKVDPYNSLRSPYVIPEGSTYSVISRVPNSTPEQLRAAGTRYPPEILEKYTVLPPTDLTRTRELARELAGDAQSPYDAIVRMNEHLRTSYAYDLSIPPQRRQMDAVEYFLFEEQRGYCEQFASSLAVMARSLGIPARIATGYAPGEYNPFTGLYEVRAEDAHAWVEVYFPGYGWSAFDPTPTDDATPWEYQSVSNIQGGKALAFLLGKTGEAITPAMRPAGSLIRGVASLDPASILIVGAIVGGTVLLFLRLRSYTANRRRKPDIRRSVKVSDARLYSRYSAFISALEKAGLIREPHETPEEFSRRASRELDEPAVVRLGEIYLYARFRNAVPAEMAGEFDRLEPVALEAAKKLRERETTRTA